MKRAALHNLGCKVNSYETEAMQQLLEKNGYTIVPFSEEADVYIINTCTVTNIADRKSRQMLHRAKKNNPEAIVVAAGCYVQAGKEDLEKDLAVDIVIGNNKKGSLISVLEQYQKEHGQYEAVIDINKTGEYESLHIGRTGEHSRAFIKVQDGCNQFCSYCIIPYARGRVRSRPLKEVYTEVEELTKNGYQEIVLTGIHLSSYGVDFQENKADLGRLIEVLHGIEGLKRIRMGSLEPRIITEEFAERLSELTKVCPHFHLSLQSGSLSTLQRMNRKYTPAEYYEKCELLRKYFKDPAITTDVIVGFPQETEEEFEESKSFLEKVKYHEIHVFKYSKREGTKAADMSGQIPEPVKGERSGALIELCGRMSAEFKALYYGRECEVLFEEEIELDGEKWLTGYTKEYIKVITPVKSGWLHQIKKIVISGKMVGEMLICGEKEL